MYSRHCFETSRLTCRAFCCRRDLFGYLLDLCLRMRHLRLHETQTAFGDDRPIHPSHQARHTNFGAECGWYALLPLWGLDCRRTNTGQPSERTWEGVPHKRAVSVTYEVTALVAVTVQTALHTGAFAVLGELPLCLLEVGTVELDPGCGLSMAWLLFTS